MVTKEAIVVVIIEYVDLSLRRPATLTFTIQGGKLKVIGEVDIGLRPAYIPTIIKVSLVYHWVSLFMVIIEMGIGLITATFLHM